MEFIVATNNAGKLKDFNLLLQAFGHHAISLKELGIETEIEETGTTFMENARIKALAIWKLTGKPAIADDSGLCVDALQGEPGVYSARFGGAGLTDQERYEKLLQVMESVPAEKRSAYFASAICAVLPDGRLIETEGTCTGEILFEPRGEGGFGYDPIFFVPVLSKTFAQMTLEEKNQISHRRKAMDEFVKKLSEL